MKYIFLALVLMSATLGQAQTINGSITVKTEGPKFYDVQSDVQSALDEQLESSELNKDGLLFVFIMHTSAAIGITESSDEEAKLDIINFLNRIAPRGDEPGISYLHSLEGPDDSPSHLKSVILNQSLTIPVVSGRIDLGRWQRIYLMEFRDDPKFRQIRFKYKPD